MKGVDTGPNMHFPRLSNSGRADFLQVTSKDNKAWVYYNQCNLGADGPGPDDGPTMNPSLPNPPRGFPGAGAGSGAGGSTTTATASQPTGTVDPFAAYPTGWEGCDSVGIDKKQFIKGSFDEFERLIPEEADQLFYYTNRAFTVGHELLHVSWVADPIEYPGFEYLVDIPMPWAVAAGAYRLEDAKWLAASDVLPNAYNNMNNYMLYALAQYIIHKKDIYPSGTVWTSNLDPAPPPPVLVAGEVVLNDGTTTSVYTEVLDCLNGLTTNAG
ncbi:hypothetical protein EJ04DRAFT_521140 [Polyplosphaeria fusca]|uniref:Uncharacterized protein n=1 Tax=Polyplosphaeria fusca TaxID=682080 RepID=A0A9P4R3F5_9PLEO|nr:hypothetical protein EJ04DRAFT_521140 [Polyplosphaeria fusca]